LNEHLSALAAREGADFSPLRTAWGLSFALRPWPILGLRLEGLSSGGRILGRNERYLSAFFLAVQAELGLDLLLYGIRWRGETGIGGGWAWTRGLIEGNGWGWVVSARASGSVLRLGNLELGLEAGYRWAAVAVLRTVREELRPRNVPALDFSGPFVGVRLSWSG
ncbi:MAG: hypothetical protein ABDI20_08650, partial [Candidatus Bipolaricaulaceae bacterium]